MLLVLGLEVRSCKLMNFHTSIYQRDIYVSNMLNKCVISLISVRLTVLVTILLNKSYLHYTAMLLLTLIFSLVLVQDFKLVFTSSALGEIMLSSSEMD